MGRTGILYSQVAKAAAELVTNGKNPTVDTVRDALGGTGSKSTIGPMLKRWKAEHQEQVQAQDVGLPANLLQAVQGLYEQLQREAEEKIEAIRTAAEAEKQSYETQLEVARELTAALAHERDELKGLLAGEKTACTRLENTLHQLQLTHTKAETTIVGLNQRLADRQSEIDGLHRQLDQARAQFEHYQEAMAIQRTEERQQTEQSRRRLENELVEARQTAAIHQAAIEQRELEMAHLAQDKDRIAADCASLQTVYIELQAEHQLQEQQIQATAVLRAELNAQVEALSGALAQTKSELAIQSTEKSQLQQRIATLDAKVQSLRDENKTLAVDKARLEGLHSQSPASGVP
jgi:chromosome segregation ATPase